MQDVIDEAMATARGAAHAHGVSVRVESASTPLPPVLGNAIELQQVVLNLVMNGIESMADVPVRRRVLVVRTQKHGRDALLVRIRDSGKGLEPQHRRRAFEGFFTTKADGLGIGLAVSRMIIEARGGRLWASANEDAGETFQFTLPVARSVADTTSRVNGGAAESDDASKETARLDA
jgi:C4-dicarboxylate-specific signal transduction histidine kinase